MIRNKDNLGIYVHIPYCQQKCHYCDFLSFDGCDESEYESYALALVKEIGMAKDSFSNHKVDTIFIGGGTPSIFPLPLMQKIVQALYESFNLDKDAEFTIESNPKTLSYDKIRGYKDLGINRISLGVQSLEEKTLALLGRIHDEKDVYENVNQIRRAGFTNLNLDIMFAIPNQRVSSLMDTLEKVVRLGPEHVSFYSLILEENTKMHTMFQSGIIQEIDEDTDREMYWRGIRYLEDNHFGHYEISNLACPHKECQHNLKYWSFEDYLGFGLGAHSFIDGKRFSNETNLNHYLENAENNRSQVLWQHQNTEEDNISEYIFTGLRKRAGLCMIDFENLFKISIDRIFGKEINRLIKDRLLLIEGEKIKLTEKGIDLSNRVMSEFILDK